MNDLKFTTAGDYMNYTNDRIRELAINAGLLNYVDHETPRHYFVHAHIEIEDINKFAELIVRDCAGIAYEYDAPKMSGPGMIIAGRIEQHFGVEE